VKLCTFCGEQISDDARICPWCAADLISGTRTTPGPVAPATNVPNPLAGGEPQTSGMAIGSLIAGVFFFVLPSAIAAVILGHISLSEIRRSASRKKGSGMALAGLILGYTGISLIPFLIIAAIAIPNLLRSRIAANEASAVASVRTINSALVLYYSTYGQYPAKLGNLGPRTSGSASPQAADLIDHSLAVGTKSGYTFHYEAFSSKGTTTLDLYRLTAEPIAVNQTGMRFFFTDQSCVTRSAVGVRADENSPEL
jgi:type IV pilus assembly protein PilA